MAAFDLIATGDVEVVDWTDDGNPGDPPRLNSPRQADRYQRVGHAGLPTTIVVEAVVDGDVAPMDEDLALGAFTWWWDQYGSGAPPVILPAALQSSSVTIIFLPENLGTWILCAYQTNGGSVRLGLSVETAG